MDGINDLDLITQRVLSLQIKTLSEQLGRAQIELEQARKRIAELEMQPPAASSEGA